MVDGGRLGRKRHTIHGLVEIDVTRAHDAIRRHKERTGESLSFTAYVMACLGQALDANREMHAYRNRRNQLVIFDEVDINTLFEVQVDGRPMIRPHVIRAVNRKSFRALHDEIRSFQRVHAASEEASAIRWLVLLPGFARRFLIGFIARNPHLVKEYMGTVSLTNIGMFGTGSGWGIPVPNHTLQITLGGTAEKPGLVAGRMEPRRYLSVTVSLDHDIVDGAPAARFVQRLRELMESAYGLDEASHSTD
jgi:pyruvate/2-oxoglutarate dehydrogenase complex dihydrolipoamide acyltransferase (E2) component